MESYKVTEHRTLVDPQDTLINPDDLDRKPTRFDELLLSGVVDVNELEGRFVLVEKHSLEDIPFIITDFTIHAGNSVDAEYVNVKLVTSDNEQLCFNDGGVGIRPILEHWREAHPNAAGLMCARGLKRSDYTNQNGVKGTTYYIA